MIKKIFLILASLFLIWQSYKLISQVHYFEDASYFLSVFVAWVLNMFITGVFAFAGFALPTQSLMPDSYYITNNPSRLIKAFKWLHVESFRKFLLATVWRNKDQRKKFFDGTKEGIDNLVVQSKKSEFGHLFPLLILTFVGVYLLTIGLIVFGVATLIFNILGNFYPIVLQRHHRMRIQKLMKRIS